MDNNSENKTYIQILLLFIGIKIN